MSVQEPTQAFQVLRQRVRTAAVLHKLASDWNIRPRNQAEVNQFMALADEMNKARDNEQIKAASDGGNPFLARALDGLRAANQHSAPSISPQLFKQAAVETFNGDKEIADAAMQTVDYLAALEQQAAAQA